MALIDYFREIDLVHNPRNNMQRNKKVAEAISNYLDNEEVAVTTDEITEVLMEFLNQKPNLGIKRSLVPEYLGTQQNPFLRSGVGIKRGKISHLLKQVLENQGLVEPEIKVSTRTCEQDQGNYEETGSGNLGGKLLYYKDFSKLKDYFSKRTKKLEVKYEFSINPR